jgi:biopolymer transport protein ExbD
MSGGAGEREDDDDLEVQHEINVTPFIDVMLVLLIIFMVAAPLSTVDIAVELPVSAAKPQPRPEKPVFVTIKSDLGLAVGEAAIGSSGLLPALDAATSGKRDTRLYLRADKSVPYGELMRVLDSLRAGGYLKVGLVGLESGTTPGPGAEPIEPGEGAR